MKNANCPKDQYMVVKFATFRGLLGTKTCGLSDDYSCEVDVTCLVKKQCDGLHECSINVDGNLFSGDLCPGFSNYLYFEYQCVDTVKHYKEPCGMHGYKYDFIDGYNFSYGLCTRQFLMVLKNADHRFSTNLSCARPPHFTDIYYNFAWQNHISFFVFL